MGYLQLMFPDLRIYIVVEIAIDEITFIHEFRHSASLKGCYRFVEG